MIQLAGGVSEQCQWAQISVVYRGSGGFDSQMAREARSPPGKLKKGSNSPELT